MGDSDRPTYTEAMVGVKNELAILDERSRNTNERLDRIEEKLDQIADLKEDVATLKAKMSIGSVILGGLSFIGSALAAALGMRQ